MAITRRSFFLLLFISLLVSFVFAEIHSTKIESDDRHIILFDEFGFTRTGHLELNVSQVTLLNRNPNLDSAKLGFFLCTNDAWKRVRQQLVDEDITCALESDLIKFITDLKFLNGNSSFETVFQVNNAGPYTLIFTNCLNGEVEVSMSVRSAMYNLEGKENRRNYLSAGETILPAIYFLSSLVSFALAGIWIYVLYKRRLTASLIHSYMLVFVILKAFNLLFEYENKHHIERTGRAHDGDTLFHIFSSLKGAMFFTFIALIATGWPHFKPYLQDKERKVLMTVIPLQVFAHIVLNSIEEYSTDGPFKSTWIIVTSLFQLTCCAMSLWMFGLIRNLREAARSDKEAAVKLKKLADFVLLYAVVICYIYLPRVVVYALGTITTYMYAWMGVVVGELIRVGLCVFAGCKSMPEAYSAVDDEEKDVIAEQLLTENDKQNGE